MAFEFRKTINHRLMGAHEEEAKKVMEIFSSKVSQNFNEKIVSASKLCLFVLEALLVVFVKNSKYRKQRRCGAVTALWIDNHNLLVGLHPGE